MLFFLYGGYTQAQSKLVIDSTNFDFGMVVEHSTVIHRFLLKSTGADTLVIQDIKVPCGCTVAPLEVDRIAPGESTSVSFYWNIRCCQGAIQQTPYIFTNASVYPYQLLLTAECSANSELRGALVSISPPSIVFRETITSGSTQVSFLIENLTDEDLSVALISTSLNPFEFTLPDSLRAGSTAQGFITMTTESWSDELMTSATLEFHSETDIRERLTLAIAGGSSRVNSRMTTIER